MRLPLDLMYSRCTGREPRTRDGNATKEYAEWLEDRIEEARIIAVGNRHQVKCGLLKTIDAWLQSVGDKKRGP